MKSKKFARYFASFMILNLLAEVASPTVALALTNGPVQQEFTGFEPANSSEMVDLFTGDFKYNIPLMDVDGYPLNLSYKAGVNMESEASWVGLGWSLNPGVLNRLMKGLPDDFNGEEVRSQTKVKPYYSEGTGTNESHWFGGSLNISIYQIPIFNVGGQVGAGSSDVLVYNSYKGYGYERSTDSHMSWNAGIGGWSTNQTTGYNTTYNSQDGGSFMESYSSGLGYFGGFVSTANGQGKNYNTRNGAVTNTYFSSQNWPVFMGSTGIGYFTSLPAGPVSYTPKIPFDLTIRGRSNSQRAGLWGRVGAYGVSVNGGSFEGTQGFYTHVSFSETNNVKSYGYLYSHNAGTKSLMDFNRFRDLAIQQETPYASFSSSTYDLFFASAQGMSSSFRPFRSEVSVVRDPTHTSSSSSSHSGSESGTGALTHNFNETTNTHAYGSSNEWYTPLLKSLAPGSYTDVAVPVKSNFSVNAPKAFVERTYFKELGELTERDGDFEQSLGSDTLVRPVMVKAGAQYQAHSTIASIGRKKRDKRSKNISCLTSTQADQYGFESHINLYDKNVFTINSTSKLMSVSTNSVLNTINRLYKTSATAGFTNTSVADHISEVSVTNPDGGRYIYGIPSYNLYKKTVVFNASDRKEGPYVTNGTTDDFSDVSSYTYPALDVSQPCQFVQYANDDVTDNKRGLDNLLQTEELPAYASSYLLTCVLSPDYVDVTGDGPSYDDLGSFTKFNYSKENDYQWREPFCIDPSISGSTLAGGISTSTSQALLTKGNICDELDDKAQYQYGVRESYYLHSIETKNYVAVFKTSERSDALGVQNEAGAKNTSHKVLKLDAIELYAKNEILHKGGISSAVPLKSVHFEYDYTLCPKTFNTISTDNPTNGKLTLKKVYFCYGSSKKSSLSPFTFTYADNTHTLPGAQNYTYSPGSNDRWGTYKPNSGTVVGSTTGLNTIEFPYSEQNKTLADQYAAAWNLTEIRTPSGATIKITYEADDYGYVQNQPASQMCAIYSATTTVPNFSINVVSSIGSPTTCNMKNNPQLIVDLSSMSNGIPTSMSRTDASSYAKKLLFAGGPGDANASLLPYKPLYFKSFMKVAGPECSGAFIKDFHEYITGYADVLGVELFDAGTASNTYTVMNSAGTGTTSCYRFAYVTVEPGKAYQTDNGKGHYINTKTSPMCLAGWDFLRNNVPRIAYPGSEPANMGGSIDNPKKQLVSAQVGLALSKTDLENGKLGSANKRFYDNNFCTQLFPAKSFVRIYSANHKKLGGGHRVKSITMEDNWNAMTSGINNSSYAENNSIYGQSFDYTTIDPISGENTTSGVAFYEPLLGGEENSLRQPVHFEVEKTFAPNDHFFQEEPLGEMMYPAAIVGYSKVTVRATSDASLQFITGNGKTEYEFYTAKDFPIKDHTETPQKRLVEKIPDNVTLKTFFKQLKNTDYEAMKVFYMTQGNLLRFNDMHGKLRSVAAFGEDDLSTPVSKVEHFYKTRSNDPDRRLENQFPTIDENNVISTHNINMDIDLTASTRENVSNTQMTGDNSLFELGLMVIFPVPPAGFIITPDFPTISDKEYLGSVRFGYREATLTKVVQEYGVAFKTVKTFNGSHTTIENLLWDANTGSVVLTKTQNNLDQPVYNFNYPAYWAHREMGPEFKRDGIALLCPAVTSSASLNIPLDVSTGTFNKTAVNDPVIFLPGDEVIVSDISNPSSPQKIGDRFWLIHDPSSTNYLLVDREGKLLKTSNYGTLTTSNDYLVRLIKPVNHNKLNASMGYVASLSDPVNPSTKAIDYTLSGQKILDAGAQQFCSGGASYTDPLLGAQSGVNLPEGAYLMNTVNPVIAQGYGDVKPINSFKYKTTRSYAAQPNSKADGLYPASGTNSFVPFWFKRSTQAEWTCILAEDCSNNNVDSHGNWIPFVRDSYYSPHGNLVETKDAINVPSARRYGFGHTLPVLSANNANATEVAFDSFEEYTYTYPYLAATGTGNSNVFNNDAFGFYNQASISSASSTPVFTTTAAHTGKYSLSFATSQTVNLSFKCGMNSGRTEVLYGLTDCGCRNVNQGIHASRLSLQYGKPYVISLWVKGKNQALDYSGLVNLAVSHTYGTSSSATPTISTSKSAVINGWQKLDYEVTLSGAVTGTSNVSIAIGAGAGTGFYLDDIRIQPFNATMNCTVYDPHQLRVCAELDDRNYATIYEYDQEGMLVRKKKETRDALYTIQEMRSGTNKR